MCSLINNSEISDIVESNTKNTDILVSVPNIYFDMFPNKWEHKKICNYLYPVDCFCVVNIGPGQNR